jgi:hypothetical protein
MAAILGMAIFGIGFVACAILFFVQQPNESPEYETRPLAWSKSLGLQFGVSPDGVPFAHSVYMYAINKGVKEVKLNDAYIISGLTSDRIQMTVGEFERLQPSQINPIPPEAKVELRGRFNGETGLSAPDFITRWSKITFVAQYDDQEYRSPAFDLADEARKVVQQHLPKPPVPSVTKRGDIPGAGGRGGTAVVTGDGRAYGGKAGDGGPPGSGVGGAGGDAHVGGDGVAVGGEGGSADGRGGRSPLEKLKELGLETEGTRFMLLYGKLRQEYILSHDGISPALIAGTESIPEDWINKRLAELGHFWRVKNTSSGFTIEPTK